MPKYKISLNDLQNKDGGAMRLYKDGHSKQDILQAIHRITDQNNFTHKTREDQRTIVDKLFTPQEQ